MHACQLRKTMLYDTTRSFMLSQCFMTLQGVLLIMKTLKVEQYVAIKVYEFTVFANIFV